MCYKIIKKWFLSGFLTVSMTQGAEVAQNETNDVFHVVKETLKKIDTKIVDPLIVTTCAGFGATFGDQLVTWGFNQYYGNARSFNPNQRLEDNIGACIGTAIGFELGRHIVVLRHKITDPLFFYGSELTTTLVSVSAAYTIYQAEKCGRFIQTSLQQAKTAVQALDVRQQHRQ